MPLTEARQIPVGSILDTRKGKVRLTSARNLRRKSQAGVFFSGVFQVLQSRNKRAKGLTRLRLVGEKFGRCRTRRAQAGASARRLSRRAIRRLGARAKGRFQTRGRYSSATVRGTDWVTADRCDGTLTTVKRGKVIVRDFRRGKTIVVRAGKNYLARASR